MSRYRQGPIGHTLSAVGSITDNMARAYRARPRTCVFCGRTGTREFGTTRKGHRTACLSATACDARARRRPAPAAPVVVANRFTALLDRAEAGSTAWLAKAGL